MSDGDRYRDYDPNERVVELQHEVEELQRELAEAKRARADTEAAHEKPQRAAKNDRKDKSGRPRKNQWRIPPADISTRDRLLTEERTEFEMQRDRLKGQIGTPVATMLVMVAFIAYLSIRLGVGVALFASVLAALGAALWYAVTLSRVREVERQIAACNEALDELYEHETKPPRMRISSDEPSGGRRAWDDDDAGDDADGRERGRNG